MASTTVLNTPFPSGAAVSVYGRNGGPPLETPTVPGQALVASAVAASGGAVALTGLVEGAKYWAVGQDSAGAWRWVSFRVDRTLERAEAGSRRRLEQLEDRADEIAMREIDVVDEFGAVGDGVANDQPALAAAATNALLTGRIIYLRQGTFRVASTWALPSNVYVRGAGEGLTVIKAANSLNAQVVTANGRSKVYLSDLTIDGNQANQSAGSCFTANNLTDFSFSRVEFANGWNAGMILDIGCARGGIRGCYVHDNGNASSFALSGSHGIALSGTAGVPQSGPAQATIEGCFINDNYGGGINASQCIRCTFTGNTMQRTANNNTGYAGIRFSNGCRGCTATGNTIVGYSRGFFATEDAGVGSGSSWFNQISGNYVEGAWFQGALISCSYTNITGNTFKDCNSGGTPDGCIRAAVVGAEDILHCVVNGNTIIDTTGAQHTYGIRTTDSTGVCDYFSVKGNTIKGFLTDALIVGGINSFVGGNPNAQTIDRPAAATLIVRDSSDLFRITNNTPAITAIATSARRKDRVLTLYCVTSTLTITHGTGLQLQGSVNFGMTAGSMLELKYVQTTDAWIETGRRTP